MDTKRETYLDIAKFLAIYLVVVHHLRDYTGNPDVYPGMTCLENLGLVFTVAVFFAVSGYLARRMMQQPVVSKLAFRAVVGLWPLLSVVATATALGCLLQTGTVRTPPDGWIRYLLSVGWFFGCLVICETVTFFAHLLAKGRKGILVAGLAVGYLVLLAIPAGLCHALEMIPFYWFGLFVLPRLLAWRHWAVVGVLSLVLHVGACVVLGDLTKCRLSYHHVTMHLLDFSWRGLGLLLARYAIGLTAACGGILTLRLLERLIPFVGRLAFLGTQTLGVFYFHMIVLNVYVALIGWTGGGLAGRLALSFLLFVVMYGLVAVTRRIDWLNIVLWNPLAPLMHKGANRG